MSMAYDRGPRALPEPWRSLVWNALFIAACGSLTYVGGLFFAKGDYLFAALVAALVAGAAAVLMDRRLITVLWLAGMPSVFVFPNNLLDVVPLLTVDRAIFIMLLVAFLVAIANRRDHKAPFLLTERLGLVFLAIITMALIIGVPGRDAEQRGPDIVMGLHGYAMPILGFFLVRRMDWTMDWVWRLMIALMLMGALNGVVAIGQITAGVNLLAPTWIELNTEHAERATGAFANSTEFGAACLLGLVCSIWVAREAQRGWLTLLASLCAILALIGVGLCQTRANWLATILVLAFIAFADPKFRPVAVVAGIVGVAVLALSIPVIMDSAFFRERVTELSPIYNRITSFATALNLIGDNPLFGVGFGRANFELAKPGYYADLAGVSGNYAVDLGPPHNEWIHVIAMLGIPAGLLCVAVWVALGRIGVHIARDERASSSTRRLGAYALAFFLSLVLTSFFVDLGYFYYYGIAAWGLMGVAAGAYERDMLARHRGARP